MSYPPIFSITPRDDVLIIAPIRDVNSFERADLDDALADLYRSFPEDKPPRVLLDFHQLTLHGTTMLTAMLSLWKRVKDLGGKMVFCRLSAEELEVLRVTRLDTVWPIYPDRDAALAALA